MKCKIAVVSWSNGMTRCSEHLSDGSIPSETARSLLTQLAEYLTLTQGVSGSSPLGTVNRREYVRR